MSAGKCARGMRILVWAVTGLLMAACASIGRPEGGPRDKVPPKYVRSNPAPGTLNFDRERLEVIFDENIKLEDPANKVVVSPAQKQAPQIRANGKKVSVELRDTLQPNTTYTVDFSDAIRDLNEGNILDGFALDFSTGDQIDTLRISGMVFEARTLEPAQGMVVGVYREPADTALTTLPLERVAKTNQSGQFTIRNLKPGNYRVYAIDDRNRDWHWDRSENIAFFPLNISPSTESVEVTDTLRASDGTDSLVVRQGTHFLPDDLLLTWFNENYKAQYLRDNARPEPRTVIMKFGAALDSMPVIKILNGPREGRLLEDLSVIETRPERDSLVYWLRDTALVAQDSLLVEARYRKTDSLENLVWQTDTLKLFNRVKRKKEKEKKKEEADTLPPPIPLLDIKTVSSSSQDLHLPAIFEFVEPLGEVDSLGVRLEWTADTIWKPVKEWTLKPDTASVRRLVLSSAWQPGTKYRFTADSMAIKNIYGVYNKDFEHNFTTKQPEDYGNIYFTIGDAALVPDSLGIIVELLDGSDRPQSTAKVKGGSAAFHYVTPGTYYARAFIDRNGDGEWTTGNVADSIQPEDVFYLPKKLNLRRNWDIEMEWSLFDTPVDLQKPYEIKRNKPKNSERDARRGDDEEEEEEDDGGFYNDQGSWGNGSRYNNSHRRGGIGSGGLQTNRPY